MRVHRLSPLVGSVQALIGLFTVLLIRDDFWAFAFDRFNEWWMALAAVAGLFAVIWAVSGIWWRATRFEIGEEITFEHGVFFKTSRSAKRVNIQAVDVVEPLLPRLFGLAELRIETAGGSDSVIAIRYLRPKHAHELREQILAQPSTHPAAADVVEPHTEVAQATLLHPHDESDIAIPEARALFGAVLQQLPWIVLILIGFGVFDLAGIGLFAVLITVLTRLFSRLDRAWCMQLRFSDTLDITYGLLNRSHNAIPLHRVHAAKVKQYPLWRFFGWWEVTLAVSGYTENTTVLPVGSREEVEQVLRRIFGRDIDIAPTFTSPRKAKWVSPIDWQQQQVEVAADHVVLSHGRLAPKRVIVNRADIQALQLGYGPVKKRLGLAHLDCKVVHGPVHAQIKDLRTQDAAALMRQLRVG